VKVYFAGPDVFSRSYGAFKKMVAADCAELGLEPLFPGDEVTGIDPAAIFRDNLALIDRADAVVANLNPFRGAEPDSGTVFELGYAYARGKRLFGYVEVAETNVDRLERIDGPITRYGSDVLDRQGNKIESFGLPMNLMICVPAKLTTGSVRECLALLANRQVAS
jgi:nucleoside 2-deoxyribosyltransferase